MESERQLRQEGASVVWGCPPRTHAVLQSQAQPLSPCCLVGAGPCAGGLRAGVVGILPPEQDRGRQYVGVGRIETAWKGGAQPGHGEAWAASSV